MQNTISEAVFRVGLQNAAMLLSEKIDLLNQLNVFPTSDRDTGTNMAIAIRNSVQALVSSGPFDTPQELFLSFCDILMENARGNSGNILSMFMDGFSEVIPTGTDVTGPELAEAFRHGALIARDAVDEPVDGTILSVAKTAGDAVSFLAQEDESITPSDIIRRWVTEAHSALTATAYRNPKLKDLHIADSGAYGFCLIMDGLFMAEFPEEPLPPYEDSVLIPTDESDRAIVPLTYRYCTEFLLKGTVSDAAAQLRQEIEVLGDCLLIHQRDNTLKVHIHTGDPEKVLTIAASFGEVTYRKIDDMML